MGELQWFLLFWIFVAALGAVEHAFGARPPGAPLPRWTSNIGLGVLNGLVGSTLPAGTVAAAMWAEANGYGLINVAGAPFWLAVVATILVRSLGQYGFHRLMHASPLLWRVHRVHHSDPHLDGTTGLRFHPFEFVAGLALLVPLVVAAGVSPVALAAFEVVEIVFGIVTHTSLAVPRHAERLLAPFLVTPGLHRVHHSDDAAETDTNYGTVLTLWDLVFGTYLAQPLRDPSAFRVGLDTVSARDAQSIEWLLAAPFSRPSNPSAASVAKLPEELREPKSGA